MLGSGADPYLTISKVLFAVMVIMLVSRAVWKCCQKTPQTEGEARD